MSWKHPLSAPFPSHGQSKVHHKQMQSAAAAKASGGQHRGGGKKGGGDNGFEVSDDEHS